MVTGAELPRFSDDREPFHTQLTAEVQLHTEALFNYKGRESGSMNLVTLQHYLLI
jgi:hypothetical protein